MKINYDNRMKWVDDPSTYQHLIKKYCVTCDVPIEARDYIDNGNFCHGCCVKAMRNAHRRIWEKREMDELRGVVIHTPHLNSLARK